MRIKQLADAAAVPVDTVRHYEKSGLLGAARRSGNGYRSYLDTDVDRLRFIRHCRELDMSLDEVRELLRFLDHPHPDCSAADAVVRNHLGHVRERLAALKQLERQLVRLVAACGHPRPQERCGIVLALQAPDPTPRQRAASDTAPRRRAASDTAPRRRAARGVHSA